ncbi:hypothetical protein CAP35_08480 [Chitinophagaceae bacterium IBVUCB1]|nr:hypothetical protein CAP35_08480 [Chitinophagaceae bacterium IBVUCB1]
MKKIYSLATILLALVVFSSCKKEYECSCKVSYVVDGQVVNKATSRNTIRSVNQEDAARQCVYYERQEDYLGKKAVVQYDCDLRY